MRKHFLSIGFQFDSRSRIEAGIDGIAEVMIEGHPTARMIAVQVKSTRSGRYSGEDDFSFTYSIKPNDVKYWKNTNLPLILVLYRESDESFFWKHVDFRSESEPKRLVFIKSEDSLNKNSVSRLHQLTVPKTGFGYYVPAKDDGEQALVNLLPVILPSEMYVATSSFNGRTAAAELLKNEATARFDWTIKDGAFWSFYNPEHASTRAIIDIDQIETVDTCLLAEHEDMNERNNFAFLLKKTLRHQYRSDLRWSKSERLLYFSATEKNKGRRYHYKSTKSRTHADVVNVMSRAKEGGGIFAVRHHAFLPKFEYIANTWYLIVTPTYFFTIDGFKRHSFPQDLLAGKKRFENNASLRGQVILWHRFLTDGDAAAGDLFSLADTAPQRALRFGAPPEILLPKVVPEDVWGKLPLTRDNDPSQMEFSLNDI